MRHHAAAIGLLLAILGAALTLDAQTPGRALSGYRYVFVVPPQYPNGVDVYGFGRYLAEKLRQDRTWTLLNEQSAPEQQDRSRANETVTCVLTHDGQGGVLTGPHARLLFYDIAGVLVTSVDQSPGAVNGWSFQGDIKRAIDRALKIISQDRRFDPSLVVDLATRYKNVERIDIDEETFRRYLDDNADRLHGLEGIWTQQDGQYRLGLMRLGNSDRMVAFVLESRSVLWQAKMLKATFEATAYPELFTVNYFMADHRSVGATAKLAGGLLTVSIPVDGKETAATFVKNYPPNVSQSSGPTPDGKPSGVMLGTGFAVGRNLVATCNHVIHDAKRIEVIFQDGKQSFPLDVLVKDEANDLAVLRVLPNDKGAYPTLTPVAVAGGGEVRLGQQVYTIGFPLGSLLGESPKATEGTVSAMVGLGDDPRTYQITVPIQPGNSGGPLFDDKGRAVGIVVASLSAKYLYQTIGTIPQSVNFAVRADYLLTLLQRSSVGVAPSPPLVNLPRVDQIDRLRVSVGQIRAYAQ